MHLLKTFRKTAFWEQAILMGVLLILVLLMTGIAHANSAEQDNSPASPPIENLFYKGIQQYRQENYAEALKTFAQLHEDRPEDPNTTYYLAMTYAQLGYFQEARTLYEAVIAMAPQSKSASLARQGLDYLPKDPEALLVAPPEFHSRPNRSPEATTSSSASDTGEVSPQDVMAWQAMMAQMGGGKNPMNGMNPMAGMFGMSQKENTPGQPAIDPNVFTTMMMNQMLENFNLGGGNNRDND